MKHYKPKLGEPVFVEWVDSHTDGRWLPVDSLIEASLRCSSSGFLVHLGADRVVIASSCSHSEGSIPYGGLLAIPRCSIKAMRRLR